MGRKKKKKRVLKIKNILIFLIVIIILSYLIYYALTMPIKNIYISGNKIISDEEIISLAKLNNYPSFLLTLSSNIKENITSNDYIETVTIKKDLGNIVEINITEYKVLAIIESENAVILSSGEKLANNYNITDAPILVNEIDTKVYDEFIKMFSRVDIDILRQVSQLEYSPVTVDNERFLLYMDDGNLVYITLTKIDKLNKYNDIKSKMEGQKGIIYLDSGDYIELKQDDNVTNTPTSDNTVSEDIDTNDTISNE